MRKIIALAAVMIILCAVSACAAQTGGNGTNDDKTVGEVNGEKITQTQLDKYVQLYKVSDQGTVDGVPEITPEIEKQMQDEMFQELVTTLLINQGAAKQNITLSKTETEQIYKEWVQSTGEAQVSEFLAKTGLNEDDAKYMLSTQILSERLMENIAKQVKISDEDVRAYYDLNLAGLNLISHILVTDEDKAEEIIAQLNSGADFSQLAKENSIDGSRDQGGYVGPSKTGQWVEPFENAALSLQVGEITQMPVQSQFGYHIIKADAAKPFEESRNAIVLELQDIKGQEAVQQYMDNLRNDAVIIDNRAA
ncbi:MAG: peptidylprolyl isomerase [Syntrophomonadaceae bacterium]|nr:peptidylprolyl isomerase [Syntrophomonadaceae bacterium]